MLRALKCFWCFNFIICVKPFLYSSNHFH